jgi:hypothetical protein
MARGARASTLDSRLGRSGGTPRAKPARFIDRMVHRISESTPRNREGSSPYFAKLVSARRRVKSRASSDRGLDPDQIVVADFFIRERASFFRVDAAQSPAGAFR